MAIEMNRKRRYRRQIGMTLVEVMTVLFIIGLTTSLVALTLPERPTQEQATAQAFARVLREAQETAILAGQPVGLKLEEQGYGLVRWRQNAWRPQGRLVRLSPRMDITLRADIEDRPETWPEHVFDPTGIVEPAEFEFRARGVRIDIALNEAGEVRLVER